MFRHVMLTFSVEVTVYVSLSKAHPILVKERVKKDSKQQRLNGVKIIALESIMAAMRACAPLKLVLVSAIVITVTQWRQLVTAKKYTFV